MNGSPPFSRTTRRPRRACSSISSLMRPCETEWPPAILPTQMRSASRRARFSTSSATSRSCRITSASCRARSAFRVSRPASPGPAPTSTTLPRRGASALLQACARVRARRSAGHCCAPARATCPRTHRLVETATRIDVRQPALDPSAPALQQACQLAERPVEQCLEPLAHEPRQHGRDAAARNRDDQRRAIDDRRHDGARELRVVDDIDEHVALASGGRDRCVDRAIVGRCDGEHCAVEVLRRRIAHGGLSMRPRLLAAAMP